MSTPKSLSSVELYRKDVSSHLDSRQNKILLSCKVGLGPSIKGISRMKFDCSLDSNVFFMGVASISESL